MEKWIYSPTKGVVNFIKQTPNMYIIGIYIRGPYDLIQDDHGIYAPISGQIVDIKYSKGDFIRYTDFYMYKGIFTAKEHKKGILSYFIKGKDVNICFQIEVGEGYVTDTIKMFKTENDIIKQGEHIGQIIIGSFSLIYIPIDKVTLSIKPGDVVHDKIGFVK